MVSLRYLFRFSDEVTKSEQLGELPCDDVEIYTA